MKYNQLIQVLLLLFLIVTSLSSKASIIYKENFESGFLGSLPTGWVATGDAMSGISNSKNHTGLTPTWSTPDFGSTGTRSLEMAVGSGSTRSTLIFDIFSGTTGEFEFNWTFYYEQGMSGLVTFNLYGGNFSTDRDLLTTVTVDLSSNVRTMDMLDPNIHLGAENFTSLEIILETNASSLGGSIFMDDISLEDQFDTTPPTENTNEFIGLSEIWEEHMVTYNATTAKCCSHQENITHWNHNVSEPGILALLSIGLQGLYFYSRRKQKVLSS